MSNAATVATTPLLRTLSPALRGLDSCDEVMLFDKFAFDRPADALRSLPSAVRLAVDLRAGDWDTLVLLHHLTTPLGIAKYAALSLGSGAARRIGLDHGRGLGTRARGPHLGPPPAGRLRLHRTGAAGVVVLDRAGRKLGDGHRARSGGQRALLVLGQPGIEGLGLLRVLVDLVLLHPPPGQPAPDHVAILVDALAL